MTTTAPAAATTAAAADIDAGVDLASVLGLPSDEGFPLLGRRYFDLCLRLDDVARIERALDGTPIFSINPSRADHMAALIWAVVRREHEGEGLPPSFRAFSEPLKAGFFTRAETIAFVFEVLFASEILERPSPPAVNDGSTGGGAKDGKGKHRRPNAPEGAAEMKVTAAAP